MKITSKTSEQIDADFAVAFADVKPAARPHGTTHAERLAPYRKAIMKQRRRGLTWAQIATVMAHPMIDEKVTSKLLQKVFGRPRANRPTGVIRATLSDGPK